MSSTDIVIWGVAAALVFWLVGAYNRLVRLRAKIVRTFAPVHTQLLQRQTLLQEQLDALTPSLTQATPRLDAVRAASQQCDAACDHARVRPGAAGAIASLRLAEEILRDARARLPGEAATHADQAVLNTRLAAADTTLAFARTLFNDAVVEYNTAVAQFPTVLIVGLFGFRAAGTL